jgi:hypothetical protein
MLNACLKDDLGGMVPTPAKWHMGWPLTQEFIWGVYGPDALPYLAKVLDTSNNPVELQSAMLILAKSQYIDALPQIRKLALAEAKEVRRIAVCALGLFGHPGDYDILMDGVKTRDADLLPDYVRALGEYGDLQAVPYLIPLLRTSDERLRREVVFSLMSLPTPASLEALAHQAAVAVDMREKKTCNAFVDYMMNELGLTREEYAALAGEKKEELFKTFLDGKYRLPRGENLLTHGQFLALARNWRDTQRVEGLEIGRLLPAVTADDIDLLLDVKTAFYLRLSDERLYDIRKIDELIKIVGRSRYRKVPWVAETVEGK